MRLLYFAWVRGQIGKPVEDIDKPEGIETVGELIHWLAARGGGYATAFAKPAAIRAAINQDYVKHDQPIGVDDEIALFPPVTGG
jgi:molybdopterin synthase sulfur carrier subunit